MQLEGDMGKDGSGIKVIGMGRSGISVVDRLMAEKLHNIELISLDCDPHDLEASLAPKRIAIPLPRRGLDLCPSTLREAMVHNSHLLVEGIGQAEMIFVVTGLGGVTGSELAPFVCALTRKLGAFTIAVATIPFRFEGRIRRKRARAYLSQLRASSDALILISNQCLLSKMDRSLTLGEAFSFSDGIICQVMRSLMVTLIIADRSATRIDPSWINKALHKTFKGDKLHMCARSIWPTGRST